MRLRAIRGLYALRGSMQPQLIQRFMLRFTIEKGDWVARRPCVLTFTGLVVAVVMETDLVPSLSSPVTTKISSRCST